MSMLQSDIKYMMLYVLIELKGGGGGGIIYYVNISTIAKPLRYFPVEKINVTVHEFPLPVFPNRYQCKTKTTKLYSDVQYLRINICAFVYIW